MNNFDLAEIFTECENIKDLKLKYLKLETLASNFKIIMENSECINDMFCNKAIDILFVKHKSEENTAFRNEYLYCLTFRLIAYNIMVRNLHYDNKNKMIINNCGHWIWITGQSYIHRSFLKSYDFEFNPIHSLWYINLEKCLDYHTSYRANPIKTPVEIVGFKFYS